MGGHDLLGIAYDYQRLKRGGELLVTAVVPLRLYVPV